MKSLKTQIRAVQKAASRQNQLWKELRTSHGKLTPTPHGQALRDAATTLLAVQMIGEKKIQLLPELLVVAEKILRDGDEVMTVHHAELQQVLDKFKAL